MQLAVGLLKAVWCGTVYGLQAVEVTQRILDRLGRRPDGYKIVANLDIAIDAIFGLHVIAAANVRRMLRNWLDANGAGGLITP
jgi:hypothetical protein